MNDIVVKSVRRVVDVLELFREHKAPMNATEICSFLGYPKSSANALLKSLVTLGYIAFDAQTKQYFPSLQVTKLGDWIPSMLFGSGETLTMLKDLHQQTQETVAISMANGMTMQFISVIQGTYPINLSVSEGFNVPIFTTAVGIAQLATRPDSDIRDLIKRANRKERNPRKRLKLPSVMDEIESARSKGFAEAYDRVIPDTGAIAMALPVSMLDRALVVAVSGLSERIRRNEEKIIRQMRQVIWQYGQTQEDSR